MPRNPLVLGALLLTLGELSLTIMAAIIKHVAPDLGVWTVVFLRNLFGLLVLLPLVARQGSLLFRSNRPGTMTVRALAGLMSMYGFIYVIAHLPLAEATLVKLTAPFFMPIIGWLWLHERIGRHNTLAIAVGFIGVLFILRPGSAHFDPDLLVGVVAAALASLAMVAIRDMQQAREPANRIVFQFGLVSTLVSAVPLWWFWKTPPAGMWPWLVAMGLSGTIGQLLITRAYLSAPPGRIGPFNYTSVVFAAVLGAVFWGESLLLTTLVGSLLIFVAGLVNLYGDSRRGQSA